MKVSVWARGLDHRRTTVTVHESGSGWVTWSEEDGTGDITVHANAREVPQLQEMINDLTRLRDDLLVDGRARGFGNRPADGFNDESSTEQSVGVGTIREGEAFYQSRQEIRVPIDSQGDVVLLDDSEASDGMDD